MTREREREGEVWRVIKGNKSFKLKMALGAVGNNRGVNEARRWLGWEKDIPKYRFELKRMTAPFMIAFPNQPKCANFIGLLHSM